MEEQEKFLGDLRSSALSKGKAKTGGYVLYVTTKRIIGVQDRLKGFLVSGGGLVGYLSYRRIEKHDRQLRTELEEDLNCDSWRKILESKDLEIKRDEIQAIILKDSERHRAGHIKFQLKSGKEIEINILGGSGSFFPAVGDLLQAFYPEAIELED
jgi:hypothetical protein